MQEIRDLSDLMTLLAARSSDTLELQIHPDVHASLAACLHLGLQSLANLSTALPPRLMLKIKEDEYSSPAIVNPKDFSGYIKAIDENLNPISVDRERLRHGLAWVEDYLSSDRFSQIHKALLALCTENADSQRVDAPFAHIEEVVDWLDMIIDNRPNDLAEELREDVRGHNSIALRTRIDTRPPRYRY